MKNKLLLIIVILLSFCSGRKESKNGISPIKYSYKDFEEIKTVPDAFRHCKTHIKSRRIDIHFSHDSIDFLRGLELKIGVNRIIYKATFREHITIKDLQYCNDDPAFVTSSISIYVGDKKKGIAYLWNKKESYSLDDFDKAYIKLLPYRNGTDSYEIKFDNDLFYK